MQLHEKARRFPVVVSFRSTMKDRARLDLLCERFERSPGEILRELLRQAAEKAGVDNDGPDRAA